MAFFRSTKIEYPLPLWSPQQPVIRQNAVLVTPTTIKSKATVSSQDEMMMEITKQLYKCKYLAKKDKPLAIVYAISAYLTRLQEFNKWLKGYFERISLSESASFEPSEIEILHKGMLSCMYDKDANYVFDCMMAECKRTGCEDGNLVELLNGLIKSYRQVNLKAMQDGIERGIKKVGLKPTPPTSVSPPKSPDVSVTTDKTASLISAPTSVDLSNSSNRSSSPDLTIRPTSPSDNNPSRVTSPVPDLHLTLTSPPPPSPVIKSSPFRPRPPMTPPPATTLAADSSSSSRRGSYSQPLTPTPPASPPPALDATVVAPSSNNLKRLSGIMQQPPLSRKNVTSPSPTRR